MGYRSLAMTTSDKTHQIPVEKFELAENNYRVILADLERFVSGGNRGDLPPVYAKVRHNFLISYPSHPSHPSQPRGFTYDRGYFSSLLMCA